MTGHHTAVRTRLRVGVATPRGVDIDPRDTFVRVDADDLKCASRCAAAAREIHPGTDVLLNIDVMIANRSADARAQLCEPDTAPRCDTMLYVGTAHGLAGLIADIYVLGIADGAVLRPLSPAAERLVYEQTLAVLRERGLLAEAATE